MIELLFLTVAFFTAGCGGAIAASKTPGEEEHKGKEKPQQNPNDGRSYNATACYTFNPPPNEKLAQMVSKTGCFSADLQPLLPGTDPKQYLHNLTLRANGEYDMVLKAQDSGDLYHLVAPKSSATEAFFKSRNFLWLLLYQERNAMIIDSDQYPDLTNFELVAYDNGSSNREEAEQALRNEEYEAKCIRDIVRVNTPQVLPPKTPSEASIKQYCLTVLKEGYGLEPFEAEMVLKNFIDAGLTYEIESSLLLFCQELPDRLPVIPFRVDRCTDKEIQREINEERKSRVSK